MQMGMILDSNSVLQAALTILRRYSFLYGTACRSVSRHLSPTFCFVLILEPQDVAFLLLEDFDLPGIFPRSANCSEMLSLNSDLPRAKPPYQLRAIEVASAANLSSLYCISSSVYTHHTSQPYQPSGSSTIKVVVLSFHKAVI